MDILNISVKSVKNMIRIRKSILLINLLTLLLGVLLLGYTIGYKQRIAKYKQEIKLLKNERDKFIMKYYDCISPALHPEK